MTPEQKRAVWKAAGHLLAIALVLFLALQFNAPMSKELAFDIPCEEFTAPATLVLQLNYRKTEVHSVTARGFSGDISGATNIRFALGQHPLEPVRTQTFTLKKSDDPIQTPPYLELTPNGTTGNRVLTIGANTILHSAGSPGDAPTFSVESVSKGDIGLELGSGSVELNGERYIIPEVGLAPPGDSFHAVASAELLGVKLISEAPPSGVPEAAKSSITLVLNPQKDRLPLLRAPVPITSGLTFNGSVNPDLRVKGTSILGTIADHRVNLKIQVTSGTIDAIGIDGSPEKRKSPTLDVRGSVITLSVLQDGHELLPTFVEETLSSSYTNRSWLLILVGMIAFALFKIVDRAFSVLLEIYLPKGD